MGLGLGMEICRVYVDGIIRAAKNRRATQISRFFHCKNQRKRDKESVHCSENAKEIRPSRLSLGRLP